MASITAPHPSYSLIRRIPTPQRARTRRTTPTKINGLRVFASQGPTSNRQSPPPPGPGVDTRIHWENEDEGWVGGSSTGSNPNQQKLDEEDEQQNFLGKKFADLLKDSSDSHYQFLGVSAEADMEDIKAAYRRLSKEYHPDTTSLPLKDASVKFMKLREIYAVLSNEESRRFYDWTLAQEAASRQTQKLRMKLEDPYDQELRNSVPILDTVDRLGGRNIELGDQATSALTIDVFIIFFAICTLIYVIYFKEPYE